MQLGFSSIRHNTVKNQPCRITAKHHVELCSCSKMNPYKKNVISFSLRKKYKTQELKLKRIIIILL